MNYNWLLFLAQSIFVVSSLMSSTRIYRRKSSEDFSVAAIAMGYFGLWCIFVYSIELMTKTGVTALFWQNLVNVSVNTLNTGLVIYYHPRRKTWI